jgi:hypothetical protein
MLTEGQVLEGMISAMAERGIALPLEQVASDRAALAARLNGEDAATFDPRASSQPGSPQQQQPQAKPFTADPNAGVQVTVQESPDLAALDAVVFTAPPTPAGYKFDPMPGGFERDLKVETGVRAAFHASDVPVGIAAQVHRMWVKAMQNPPTQQEMDRAYQTGNLELHRMFGDQRENVLTVANDELTRMAVSYPPLKDMLKTSGLANNAWVVATLFNLARAKGRA